ncbi:hypothetical protein MBAV_000348 [Candidatus Magnetobacterium bavaricum]|uniref:Uncharacterized protein n=1 Tax=Candidatus Magnetobacterium bavaricum TaxID=29290 RepID=A0A0F3GZR3_9BACT|nr:hypothetical protein MBAV_000348 [Candidatus Magnetobacterium bavaricum]
MTGITDIPVRGNVPQFPEFITAFGYGVNLVGTAKSPDFIAGGDVPELHGGIPTPG